VYGLCKWLLASVLYLTVMICAYVAVWVPLCGGVCVGSWWNWQLYLE